VNLFDVLTDERDDQASRVGGVVVGVVTNNQDPEGMGRVKVKFPWLSDEDESNWARVSAPMAGKERGFYFLPEVDDEVLVAFEQGDVRFPYVVGSLWNGEDAPPAKNDDGKNSVRVIKSRSGHVVRLTDEDGKEMIEIVDKSGENSIRIDTSKSTITITSDKDIVLSASQGKITLDAKEIEVKSSGNAKVEAGGNMDLKATGQTNVKGQAVNLN
jgi:uncharacterized protein involved in type VI secretion and phage assembly